jgi:uncharacterized membrane protein YqhA
MLRRILAGSRFLVIIAVLGSFLAAVAILVYGGLTVIGIIIDVFSHGLFTPDGSKHLAIESIEAIDLFLLATVLYIIALGLYELFVQSLPMPSWLEITSLDDLKSKLIGVVIVMLAVTFLGEVVSWDGTTNILALGFAVGIVLFALAFYLNVGFQSRHETTLTENKQQPADEQIQ